MSKTILIVDDSAMIRRIASQLVKQIGHKPVVAENGEKGWQKAVEIEPDIVVMDIEMPVMDGFEATRKIKSDPRTAATPVLFFTSLGSQDNIKQAEESGGSGFLNKPICKEELSQAIDSFLKKHDNGQ